MIVPKKQRVAVYSYLFKEGILVAHKDYTGKHAETDTPNISIIKMMQSFRSKGYVREQFNWQYFYWFLTNEGIEYLRTYLHLPEDVVPNTLKKPKAQPKPAAPTGESKPAPTGRGKSWEDKKATPSADFKPEFRGTGKGKEGYRKEEPQGPSEGKGFSSGRGTTRNNNNA